MESGCDRVWVESRYMHWTLTADEVLEFGSLATPSNTLPGFTKLLTAIVIGSTMVVGHQARIMSNSHVYSSGQVSSVSFSSSIIHHWPVLRVAWSYTTHWYVGSEHICIETMCPIYWMIRNDVPNLLNDTKWCHWTILVLCIICPYTFT